MTDLIAVFAAGRVRRWHTNPHLSWTDDYLDAHQGRVARIVLALWPDDCARLVFAALTHDDGESLTGDLPWDFKELLRKTAPPILAEIDEFEASWVLRIWDFRSEVLGKRDRRRLKLADRLDAYMWAKHKAPSVLAQPSWREAADWIRAEADRLNVLDQVKPVIGADE